MLRALKGGIANYLAFLVKPAPPVLSPYRAPLAPHRALVRKTLFLTVCAFAGIFYGFVFTVFPPFLVIILSIPILVLMLVVIWSLPDQKTGPTKLLTRLLFFLLIVTVLWPNYLAIALPGMPWISVRRVVGAMVGIVLLLCLSVSSDFRGRLKEALTATPFLYYGMIGFAIIQFATLFWSDPPFSSFFLVLDHQFVWTAAFFASVWVFQQPGRVRLYAALMVGMTMFLGLMAIAEYRNQAILWASHIPSFLRVGDEAVERMLTANFRDGRYRITTTFGMSLTFSEFLAMVSPFVLHRAMNAKHVFGIAFWVIADITLLVLTYMTTARLGVVGWIAAHCFYLMVWTFRRWRQNPSDLFAVALVVALPAAGAMVLIAMTSVDAVSKRTIGGGSTGLSDTGRKEQFRMAPPVIARNPLGYSSGKGGPALGYRTPGGQLTVDSYVLTAVLDYGVIGFIIFYGAMISMIFGLSKVTLEEDGSDPDIHLALAVAGSLVAFLAAKLVLSQEDNHTLYFVLLGMACAILARHRQAMAGRAMAPPAAA